MPVQSSMQSLTAVAASNSPAGSDAVSNTLDDYLRSIQAVLRYTEAQGATLTTTASMSLAAATGAYVVVSGTDAITHLGTVDAGIERTLVFAGACTLTHNATNLILPTAANITTAAGDVAIFRSEGAGNWRCVSFTKASGTVFDIVFSLDTGANSAYTIVQKASFPFTVTNAITKTASGTITANIKIESTSITNLDAIGITDAESDTAATGANSVAIGNTVSVTFTSNSTAVGVIVQLRCVRL